MIVLVHSDALLDTTFLHHPKPKDGHVHSTVSLKVDRFSCEGSSCSVLLFFFVRGIAVIDVHLTIATDN